MQSADFWQFNVGNLLTILSFLGGGALFIASTRQQLFSLSERSTAMESELKKLVEVLINQGRQDERLLAMDQRMLAEGKRLDDFQERFNKFTNHQR